jgi:adenylate kinase
MKLIFLGPPGAGKGTIAAKVKEHYQVPHISTGDLFREAITNKTSLGVKVQKILDSGELVPDELTVEMVKERLSASDIKSGFILDGFPRTTGQADSLQEIIDIDRVINFILDEKSIIERLSGRRIAKKSGRVYHMLYDPPKQEGICDESGEALIQRPDDQPEAISKRLEVYKAQTAPLIRYYKEQDMLTDIDASPSPAEVFTDLKTVLDTLKK